MTFALALEGIDHVVMAADTLGHSNDPGGMYRERIRKLHPVNNGAWGVAVAGSDQGIDLVKYLNRSNRFEFSGDPEVDIDAYSHALHKGKNPSEQVWMLLVGLDKKSRPFIYYLDLPKDSVRPSPPRERTLDCSIGACSHGAMYFVHRYHRWDMSINNRIALAHFCASEVAEQDIRVERPIDIAVVDSSGFVCFEEAEIPMITRRTDQLVAAFSSELIERHVDFNLEALRRSKRDQSSPLP